MNFGAKKLQLPGTRKELRLSTFLLALCMAAICFVPFMIFDRGYFLFFGDFNVQQIPFYKLAHEAIRTGQWGWSWTTDLGANFIASYSFYLLGSPFFWLTLPFPTNFVPYLMGPLLILKFACAALTAYCYIRRFTRTPEAARLCALLYAFSGFSVYNIFFNHFHEAIIIFPLLLLGLELLITENRRGVFAAAVAASALINYFFFFGMVVFCVIYWVVRVCSGCYKQKLSSFFCMLFEAVLGLCLAAVLLVPSIYIIAQNSRVSSFLVGWNAITYGKEQIYLNVLQCFFFPPDLPARPVFFPGADVKWSSLGGWLPLFSMVGVFAYLQNKKRTWLRRMIGICIFMALVPVLNSAFYLFNTAYYARWFYMPILLMCLATARCLEDAELDWSTPFRWVAGITVATVAVIGFFPREMENGVITKWGLYTESEDNTYLFRFLVTSSIALLALVVLWLLLKKIKTNRKQFMAGATAAVCLFSVLYTVYFIGTGKAHSYDTQTVMIDSLLENTVDLPGDRTTYRIDVYDGVDNTAMYLNYSGINAFHSIVPKSVTDFWEYVGEERGVGSRPKTDTVAARALLGVKYLLAREGGDSFVEDSGEPKMAGFTYVTSQSGYKVYQNENYIPYGFTYDYYMTDEQCKSAFTEAQRSNMMLKAMLLSNDQIAKYSYCLKNLAVDNAVDAESFGTSTFNFALTDDEIAEDAAARRANAVSTFTREKNGFSASITLEKDNLVFFSVPYEEGWSATVNGAPVEVEKVNVGFMAVLCHAGENTIEFKYQTPYLALGVKITGAALLLFAGYCLVCLLLRHCGKLAVPEYPEGEKLLQEWKADAVAEKLQQPPEEPEPTTDLLAKAAQDLAHDSYYTPDFEQGFFVVTPQEQKNSEPQSGEADLGANNDSNSSNDPSANKEPNANGDPSGNGN